MWNFTINSINYVLESTRDDTSLKLFSFYTFHSMRFSSSSLSICKNSDVSSLEKLGDRLLEKVEDVLLGGKVWKDVTELHVGEIAWALDQKSFMIFVAVILKKYLISEDYGCYYF